MLHQTLIVGEDAVSAVGLSQSGHSRSLSPTITHHEVVKVCIILFSLSKKMHNSSQIINL